MERTRKVWGERWLLRKDSTHATSILMLEPGTECSWHKHQAKFNLFVVLSGMVEIVVEEMGRVSTVSLGPGQEWTTKPGQLHKFVCREQAVMIEEMYVEYDEGDIERETVGGQVLEVTSMGSDGPEFLEVKLPDLHNRYGSDDNPQRWDTGTYAAVKKLEDGSLQCTGCLHVFIPVPMTLYSMCPSCKRMLSA